MSNWTPADVIAAVSAIGAVVIAVIAALRGQNTQQAQQQGTQTTQAQLGAINSRLDMHGQQLVTLATNAPPPNAVPVVTATTAAQGTVTPLLK